MGRLRAESRWETDMTVVHSDEDSLVLVWQKNFRPGVVHRNGLCLSLSRSAVPARSVKFNGPGTAGWLPLHEAELIRGGRLCGHCMQNEVRQAQSSKQPRGY